MGCGHFCPVEVAGAIAFVGASRHFIAWARRRLALALLSWS